MTLSQRRVDLSARTQDVLDGLEDIIPKYEYCNDRYYDVEDEDNPQPAPRGEELCRANASHERTLEIRDVLVSNARLSRARLDALEAGVQEEEAELRDLPNE